MGDSDVIAQVTPWGAPLLLAHSLLFSFKKEEKYTVKLKINVEISSIRSSYKENFRTHSREQAARHPPSQVSYLLWENLFLE